MTQPFEGEVADARERLVELERRCAELPPQHRAFGDELLELFSTTVEELQVSGEELHQQNEELLASGRELELARQRYQDLFEFAPGGYLVTDAEGIVREANRAAGELLAVQPRRLIGRPLVAYVASTDRKAFHLCLSRLHEEWRQSQATAEWEVELRSRARGSFPAVLTVAPVCDDEEQLAGLRWLLRDVSASKRAAQEREKLLTQVQQDREAIRGLAADLERERDILHTLMENTAAQVAYLDLEFNFVQVNSAYVQGCGHSREELIGRNHFDLFPNVENQAIFERVRDSGQPVKFRAKPFEFEDQSEQGTTYWDWTLVPALSTTGEVQGLVLSLVDVTRAVQDRQWIEALSAKAQRHGDELGAILNSIPEAVVVFDAEGTIVQTNPAAEAFGFGPVGANAVLVARRVKRRYADGRLIPPDDLAFARGLRGDMMLARPEIVDNPAGGQREILASAAPVVSEGRIVASVVVSHDVTEQRRTERERERLLAENRTQREFLERLLEAAPVGIAVLRGKDHRYELANPYYRAGTTGSADTPMVGRTIVEMIPNLVKRRMPELMDEVYRTRQTVSTREVQLTIEPEGKETYWNTERVPLRGPDGAVEGILVLAQEVTAQVLDRQRIEALSAEAQRQADEREAIFATLVEPAMVFDTTGSILRANPAAKEWLGVDPVGLPEAVLGQTMTAHYPDGRPIPDESLVAMRALREERVQDDHQLLLTPDGVRAIVASSAPIVTGGQISGAVISWHDITDLRRAETALRDSEEKLRTLFDLLPIGVVVLDQDLQVLRSNPASEWAGPHSQETLHRWNHRAKAYLRSDGTSMPREALPSARALREQRLVQDEVGIVRDDGSVIWQDISTVPVPFADWKAVVTVVDITERKKAEVALRQARDELEMRVQERTAELERANERLLAEIRQRMRIEGDLRSSEQRLEQRVEERTRELATLLDISNTVALSIDLEPLLAMILERLKDVVDYDGGAAFRLEANTLNPVFHRGAISADDLLQIGSYLEEAALGRAAIPGVQQVILADAQGEPALQEAFRQATGAEGGEMANAVRAWMTVPVTIKQQVYGVLYMYHSQPGRYTEEQARLALPFGNQAAVAIENARIYQQAAALATLEERQRLAHDLHDAVTQTLFSASLAAEVLPRLWERDREAGLLCLSEVHQLTRGALAEMRTLLLELRPAALVETELGALLSQLGQAITSRARISVTIQAVPHCSLPPEVQVALYRIAQEALNNVAKHAEAKHVEVSLQCTPPLTSEEGQAHAAMVELSVADDGRGFDPNDLPAGFKGLGLGIMRERAEAIGAALEIRSHAGQGTWIAVRWPDQAPNLSPPLPAVSKPEGG